MERWVDRTDLSSRRLLMKVVGVEMGSRLIE